MNYLKSFISKIKSLFSSKTAVPAPAFVTMDPNKPPFTLEDISSKVYDYLPSDVVAAMSTRLYNTVAEVITDEVTGEIALASDRDLFSADALRSTRLVFYIGLEADSIEQGLVPLAKALTEMHDKYGILGTLQPPAALRLVTGHYLLIAYVAPREDVIPLLPGQTPWESSEGYKPVFVQEPWLFGEASRPTLYVGTNPIDYSKINSPDWDKIWKDHLFGTFVKIAQFNPAPYAVPAYAPEELAPPKSVDGGETYRKWLDDHLAVRKAADPKIVALMNSMPNLRMNETAEEYFARLSKWRHEAMR